MEQGFEISEKILSTDVTVNSVFVYTMRVVKREPSFDYLRRFKDLVTFGKYHIFKYVLYLTLSTH
jgi:hypothetical protein